MSDFEISSRLIVKPSVISLKVFVLLSYKEPLALAVNFAITLSISIEVIPSQA